MARISVLCADLEHGPLYTAWMFAGALGRRHEVQLLGPRPARLWPPAEGEIAPDHVLPPGGPLSPAARRAALAATEGSDLVYAFKAYPASVGLGLWLRRRLEVPLAVHLDDWDGGYFSEVPLPRRAWYAARRLGRAGSEPSFRVFERLAQRADLVTVSTRALQQRFGGELVRQGVDERRFRPGLVSREQARAALGVEPERPLVAFAGTPALHKGLSELVGAFGALPPRLGARLLIAGTPPDAQSKQALGRHDGVELRASLPFADVAHVVAAADVLCAPQRPTVYAQHQLPAKILHWMALGGCILATDVGDARELLGGSPAAGRVVPPLDPDALRDTLAELLQDAEQRRALGAEAARRAHERYGWGAMADTLDDLLAPLGIHG